MTDETRQSFDEHVRFVRTHKSGTADEARRANYLAMVSDAGSCTTVHDVYVSVTVPSDVVAKCGTVTVGPES